VNRISFKNFLSLIFIGGLALPSNVTAQVQQQKPDYRDEIVPLHGKPFMGKILKFEGRTLYVEITKYKIAQIISLSIDSLEGVNKDFGAIKVSVWKHKEESAPKEAVASAPLIELPAERFLQAAVDTVAAITIERDSVFVGSVDRVDTTALQRALIDQMPIPLTRATTEYPPRAYSQHLQGSVKLRLWIDKEGIPQKWEVAECSDSVFVQSSVASAMKWEFSPAVVKGTPVGVWAALTFEYQIQR